MSVPKTLAGALSKAAGEIDDSGHLPARGRRLIHLSIEELSRRQHRNAGYFRRAKLALRCAHHCLPRLSPFPELKAAASELMSLSEKALQSEFPLDELEVRNQAFHTLVDDLPSSDVGLRASYAGMASFTAVEVVAYDFDYSILDKDEIEVDPDRWDSAFYSSLAESGSAPWEKKGGTAERKAYWKWYLEHAVPEAWDFDEDFAGNPSVR
jgi:hypothetical protein